MKMLVLWEPWATAMARGLKRIETRPRPAGGHGAPAGVPKMPGLPLDPGEDLVIVAAKRKPTKAELSWWQDVLGETGARPTPDDFPRGCAVAVVKYAGPVDLTEIDVDDVIVVPWPEIEPDPDDVIAVPVTETEFALGIYGPGRWGWVTYDLRSLETPVPVKGRQGINHLSVAETAAVQRQLDERPF